MLVIRSTREPSEINTQKIPTTLLLRKRHQPFRLPLLLCELPVHVRMCLAIHADRHTIYGMRGGTSVRQALIGVVEPNPKKPSSAGTRSNVCVSVCNFSVGSAEGEGSDLPVAFLAVGISAILYHHRSGHFGQRER